MENNKETNVATTLGGSRETKGLWFRWYRNPYVVKVVNFELVDLRFNNIMRQTIRLFILVKLPMGHVDE